VARLEVQGIVCKAYCLALEVMSVGELALAGFTGRFFVKETKPPVPVRSKGAVAESERAESRSAARLAAINYSRAAAALVLSAEAQPQKAEAGKPAAKAEAKKTAEAMAESTVASEAATKAKAEAEREARGEVNGLVEPKARGPSAPSFGWQRQFNNFS
jgi:hypothetical protein